jgi:hypothetical protein
MKTEPEIKRLTIDVPAELHRAIKTACAERGTIMADEIRLLLRAEIAEPKVHRRQTTGRNVQLNIKAKQETVDRINAIADRRGWVLGEVLEHALEALERPD